MGRLNVLVLYGGMSEEHDVSVKSAIQLAGQLDAAKYDVRYAFIGRDGRWLEADAPGAEPGGPVAVWNGGLTGRDGFWPVDVAFPALHGRFGEDGAVQGLLEMAGIAYVGCPIAPSVLCMDKALTYLVAAAAGVAVPSYRVLYSGEPACAGDLHYPLFVKPARSGSSFGVSKVEAPQYLEAAVREARRFDGKVLIEQRVLGSEIGCAVLGAGGDFAVGCLDQIVLTDGFFRIHQEAEPEKGSGNAAVTVPAPIPHSDRDNVVAAAKTLCRALGVRGLARVDMFLTPEGRVVLNEVNTMPGLTAYSRYPRMMAAAGLSLGQVADRLIALARGLAHGSWPDT